MSEPVRKRSSPLLTTLFVVVVLAILYPLSLGPVVWFYDRGYLPEEAAEVAEVAYVPLAWAYDRSGPVADVYDVYLEWWGFE
jgi:hypothetical protein